MTDTDSPRTGSRFYICAACSLAFLIVLLLVDAFLGAPILDFLIHLLLGGFQHLYASVPHLMPTPWVLAGFMALFVGAVCALHALLAMFLKSKQGTGHRWRLRWTLSLVFLFLAALGTACSTIGLVHHAAWLAREPVVDSGRERRAVSRSHDHCMELLVELRRYAAQHGGKYPDKLGGLVTEKFMGKHDFLLLVESTGLDGIPVPWIYLPGLSDSGPGNVPLIFSSAPVSETRYVLGFNDGSVAHADRQSLDEALARWRTAVAESPGGSKQP